MRVYLVVGPGRCGTSKVAEVLHKQCGVFMGARFLSTEQQCYYEDLDMKYINDNFIDGEFAFQYWRNEIITLIHTRNASHSKWGFKDPRACAVLAQLLTFFDNPKIIRCRRDHESVLQSMLKNTNWSEPIAQQTLHERELLLDRSLVGREVINIDMSEHRSDEYIISKVMPNGSARGVS